MMSFGNELEIIEGIKCGSQKAFDICYKMYAPRLYSYCYSFTKSHEDAEEIVHDVFVKIWKYREKIKADDTLSYLIFHIAKNELINSYRKNLSNPMFEDYIRYNNEMAQSYDSPDSQIQFKEFLLKVEQISAKLPDKQRLIFKYKVLENKSIKEIAGIVGLQEQTVKNLLTQIMKYFREQLSDYKYLELLIVLLLY